MNEQAAQRFGRRVRTRRIVLDMSQSDLARACRVSQPAIANYEAGRRDMPLQVAVLASHALHVPLHELITIEDFA